MREQVVEVSGHRGVFHLAGVDKGAAKLTRCGISNRQGDPRYLGGFIQWPGGRGDAERSGVEPCDDCFR